MKKLLIIGLSIVVMAMTVFARSGDHGNVFDYDSLAADSSFWIQPLNGTRAMPCEAFGWDFIKYTADCGPCTLFLYSASGWRCTDSSSSDTLIIPYGSGFDMGAQGSFVPIPMFIPWELDSMRVGVGDAIDHLRLYWIPKRPRW